VGEGNWEGIASNKVRSLLTMLGIIIGMVTIAISLSRCQISQFAHPFFAQIHPSPDRSTRQSQAKPVLSLPKEVQFDWRAGF